KKAIQQTGGKAAKFDMIRARGIIQPHLTLLGTAIPKYLYSALSERSMENGLLSRCLVIEAGERGEEQDSAPKDFPEDLVKAAQFLVSLGGFDGLDLEKLDDANVFIPEPNVVAELPDAEDRRREIAAECSALYKAAQTTGEKALWSRAAEKVYRLALLWSISENYMEPIICKAAYDWAWKLVRHVTLRMLYQASVYVHDNEFDKLRQKALRYLRDYGHGEMKHTDLLRFMHIDAESFRKIIDTLLESELIAARPITRGGYIYSLLQENPRPNQGIENQC
ncbi:MAG: DUF3987 domain-containing protein, partial [Ruminococcus sp.]|nr:DUF3987 domain-containing protein [Ruminococcus sp.]